jgi:hypothetical protein
MNKCIIIVLLFFLFLPAQAESWNITRAGGVTTDWFYDVKVVDDIAYCATKFGLVLMDVRDKENPDIQSRIETNGNGLDIVIRDSILYFCDGIAGLKVYSIAEPTEPLLISECEDAASAGRIVLRDDYAYVSCGRGGMSIVDVSNPFQPEQIGRTNSECEGIALLEDYAYTGGANIRIFDIEDPSNPELLNWSEHSYNGEMSILNEVLCGRLIFYNLEDRLEPELIHRNNPYGETCHELVDEILFLPIGIVELRAPTISGFDIDDPSNPARLVSCILSTLSPNDICYEDGYIYVTHGSKGFTICDFRDWDNAEEVNTYVNFADYHNVAVQGNYAYAFDYFGRFVVISLEDPNQPVEVFEEVWDEFYIIPGTEMPLVVADDFIYTYNRFNSEDEEGEDYDRQGIYTYSIENPEAPELIHELLINWHHQAFDLKLDGDFLYGSTLGTGIMVISLENPEAPELIEIHEDFQCKKLDSHDNLLISTSREHQELEGIVIWDKSNPYNLEIISTLSLEDEGRDVAIYGNYVYFAGDWGGMWIISIEDPENPQVLNQFDTPYVAFDLEVKDGILYLSCWENGLKVFSLEDPENPELIGQYNTPGYSWSLALSDNYLCLADESDFGVYDVSRVQGLWFLELSAESHDFDSTAVDSIADWDLTLTNTSRTERVISEIIFDDTTAFFCQVEAPFTIPSESDTFLTVFFAPMTDSFYYSTLTFSSGEKDLEVVLSGRGYVPNSIDHDKSIPFKFALESAYPNPFNSTTTIRYQLPRMERVTIRILDVSGREVATLVNDQIQAGYHQATWHAVNQPTGIYFCRVETAGFTKTTKLALIK